MSRRSTIMRTALVAVLFLAPACSGGTPDGGTADGDTLTKRQRDSAVAESGLPGAHGVRGAMDVADTARARADRVDSMAER